MNRIEVLIFWIAGIVFASTVAWAYSTHRGHVAEVERCEASGGTAVIAARGYLCMGGRP